MELTTVYCILYSLYQNCELHTVLYCTVPYRTLFCGNWYRLVFLQSDRLTAGPYNTIRTTFFNFCKKSSIFSSQSVVPSSDHRTLPEFDKFLSSSIFRHFKAGKQFVNTKIRYQTMCSSCEKVVSV